MISVSPAKIVYCFFREWDEKRCHRYRDCEPGWKPHSVRGMAKSGSCASNRVNRRAAIAIPCCMRKRDKIWCRAKEAAMSEKNGRAQVGNPDANAHLVCGLLLEHKTEYTKYEHTYTLRND